MNELRLLNENGPEIDDVFPPLPLGEWEKTKNTLHRYAQIVGKVRLSCAPFQNHWWHVPLYVSTVGLRTGPMPHGDLTFEIEFDFVDHHVIITTSEGLAEDFPLVDRLSVSDFYHVLFDQLSELGIEVSILARSYDLGDSEPFESDTLNASYDREYVSRFWHILVQADQIFKTFAGRFSGKSSPVHLFWHSFNLAVTRFSGRIAPEREGEDLVTREAYSHEVVSFGFWAGDANLRAPAFYSYTAPEPAGLAEQPLQPDAAFWNVTNGSSMALLMYDDMRELGDPRQALLDFLESAYQAGAALAEWDVEGLRSNAPN
jgi:hypothetical protein